jgi:hypothetical protein
MLTRIAAGGTYRRASGTVARSYKAGSAGSAALTYALRSDTMYIQACDSLPERRPESKAVSEGESKAGSSVDATPR